MRRHKVAILIMMVLFIGLPMMFFIPGVNSLGGGGNTTTADYPIAQVGATKVTAAEFMREYNIVQQDRNRQNQPVTAQDLVGSGAVDAIIERLVREAMITERTKEDPIYPGREYLIERLKKDPFFQSDTGEFDAGLFNQWVEGQQRGGFDWEDLYRGMADTANRDMYLTLSGASARVLSSEVREQFERTNTQMKIRAVGIAPPVELSDDELTAYYESHQEDFMTPEQRIAEYVAISLEPPTPPLVDELLTRARSGEDFAELAKEYSQAIEAEEGGDLGWIVESDALRDYQRPLFEMAPGDIAGPIESVLGLHLYKLEETRENEAGQREVHARQILLRPQLSDEDRQEREALAQAVFQQSVEEDVDVATLGADHDLDLHRTSPFSNRSQMIEGISNRDIFAFSRALRDLEIGRVSEVIEGVDNLYVAEVVEIIAPKQQTFDEARDAVERAVTAERKQSPEYLEKVATYVRDIAENAESIEDIEKLYPDLPLDVKETDAFGFKDVLYNQGLFLNTNEVFGRLINHEPGDMIGPVLDLLRIPHFIELTEKITPEGDGWDEQFEAEKDQIRGEMIAARALGQRADHMQWLVNQANEDALIQKDYDAVFNILGLDRATSAPGATFTPEAQEAQPTDAVSDEPDASGTDSEDLGLELQLQNDTADASTAPAEPDEAATP